MGEARSTVPRNENKSSTHRNEKSRRITQRLFGIESELIIYVVECPSSVTLQLAENLRYRQNSLLIAPKLPCSKHTQIS